MSFSKVFKYLGQIQISLAWKENENFNEKSKSDLFMKVTDVVTFNTNKLRNASSYNVKSDLY